MRVIHELCFTTVPMFAIGSSLQWCRDQIEHISVDLKLHQASREMRDPLPVAARRYKETIPLVGKDFSCQCLSCRGLYIEACLEIKAWTWG